MRTRFAGLHPGQTKNGQDRKINAGAGLQAIRWLGCRNRPTSLCARSDAADTVLRNSLHACACARLPDDERELLLAAIVPAKPLPKERARVGTYAALLVLAAKKKARPTEGDLFDAACSMNRFGEPLLDQIAVGWTFYGVRDAIAVTQEAVMAAVMGEIMASPDGGLAGVAREQVVGGLIERVEEHDSALRDLGLLSAAESVGDMLGRCVIKIRSVCKGPAARQGKECDERLLR